MPILMLNRIKKEMLILMLNRIKKKMLILMLNRIKKKKKGNNKNNNLYIV